MEQAFVLPHPKTARYPEDLENNSLDSEKSAQTQFWRALLDRLSEKKMTWEQFFSDRPILNHPALRLMTSKSGETLLHLAVLSNRCDIAKGLISSDPYLKVRRNAFGLTALELAQFLHRKEIIQLLSSRPRPLFSQQPNLLIRDAPLLLERLEFLANPVFESEEVLEEVLAQSQKAKMEDLIPSERIWMGVYFDKEIQDGFHPLVSIRYLDAGIGFGCFAEQKIPTCAYVGEYTGVVRRRNKKWLKEQHYSVRYAAWEANSRKYILDSSSEGNFTRFINHSQTPNLCLQSVYWRGIPRMVFVALEEIVEGSQLTFDYGTLFWKEKEKPRNL